MPNVKKKAGKKGPSKRKLAEEFSPGEVFTDQLKKDWKLGPAIGKGGFGCLYLADINSSKPVGNDAPYVIKVEPSENGPLFTELRFYTRAAKPELIKKWIASHKLKYIGVPRYWGCGSHEKNGRSYRFMVMERFGKDLQKIFEEKGKRFTRKTVLQLGLKILDILEYVHEQEYVHGDIKASNLLLSYKTPHQVYLFILHNNKLAANHNKAFVAEVDHILGFFSSVLEPVYLVDYGLAYRYCPEGTHKDYKEDPKRCHDGTLEYTSIDAHNGVAPSRRGDLQILGFCMIHWLTGHLPWEDNLKDPNYVRDSKIRYTDDIAELMRKCFTEKEKPGEIARYMEKVMALNYSEKPPYQQLREILLRGLKDIGQKDDGILDFSISENEDVPAKAALKARRKLVASATSDLADAAEDDTETAMDEVKTAPKRKRAPSKARVSKSKVLKISPKVQKVSPKNHATMKPKKRTQK